MAIVYRKAGQIDLEQLIAARMEMLCAVNGIQNEDNLREVSANCRAYYLESFETNTHAAYLAYEEDELAGCGGISFYRVPPSFKNPTGWRAYIMNIYTVPKYRGRGIATGIVDLLVKEARLRNIRRITLDATAMGRPVYERYGFAADEKAMTLPFREER